MTGEGRSTLTKSLFEMCEIVDGEEFNISSIHLPECVGELYSKYYTQVARVHYI